MARDIDTADQSRTISQNLTTREKLLILAIPLLFFHLGYFVFLLWRKRFTKSDEFWKYVAWSYAVYLLGWQLFLLFIPH